MRRPTSAMLGQPREMERLAERGFALAVDIEGDRP
jgi:hypothetical protein